jgi:DNA polymerase III subunit chi
MPQIDFYVLSDAAPDAHFRYACKLAEREVDGGRRVFIRTASDDDTRRLDDLLWTFGDRSFLPHEIVGANTPSHERVRILIGATPPVSFRDVLINLGETAPDMTGVERLMEIVATDPERKRLARERFKAYRDQGVTPSSQNI